MIEKVLKVKYIGKPEMAGINRDEVYEIFVVQTRTGCILEVLIEPKIGSRENKLIPYSNEKSILTNWEIQGE